MMRRLVHRVLSGLAHLITISTCKTMPCSVDREYGAKLMKQTAAGLFFSICSILIVMVNKVVLTTYR